MKAPVLFIILLFLAPASFAQISPQTPWTWMKGDNDIDQPGIYGTQGVTASTNKPGSRNSSVTWRDSDGNLWLFGGSGFSANASGYLNDLWKYDPYSNQWTWMKGDNTTNQYSVYGTQGNANTNNKPGGIYYGVSWQDENGNLWLFGGFGYTNNSLGFLNALWKYNPSTNQWTWMKGDKAVNKAAVYGTKGVAGNNNKPGARYGCRTWTDAGGNLWLFGGYGYDAGSTAGILNDVWKYSPSTNQWTWVSGDNGINQHGVYGTKGVASSINQPGSRYVSTSWTDASGNLWLFGGYGYDDANEGNLNDMWKYDPSSNQWTWVSGDSTINQTAFYGAQGSYNTFNKPGARYVSSSWTDINGDLWLFGGYGYGNLNMGYLNDFWKYSTTLNQWQWVKGDSVVDQVGIYGTQGMPDYNNKSGSRNGSVSWTDDNGNLWFFGGYGYDDSTSGVLNDLWRISNFQAVLPLHLLKFDGVLHNNTASLHWQSEQEDMFSHFNVQRSFDGTDFSTIGKVEGAGNNNLNNYQYADNGLAGLPYQVVYYRLQLVNNDGSYTYSKILRFDNKQSMTLSAYPNPAVNSLTLSFEQKNAAKTAINVVAMNGQVVKNQVLAMSPGRVNVNLDVSALAAGTYILTVSNDEGTQRLSLIKQ